MPHTMLLYWIPFSWLITTQLTIIHITIETITKGWIHPLFWSLCFAAQSRHVSPRALSRLVGSLSPVIKNLIVFLSGIPVDNGCNTSLRKAYKTQPFVAHAFDNEDTAPWVNFLFFWLIPEQIYKGRCLSNEPEWKMATRKSHWIWLFERIDCRHVSTWDFSSAVSCH